MSIPAFTPAGSRRSTRLSVVRIVLAALMLAALVSVSFLGVRMYEARAGGQSPRWFAGYVDVTATPRYAFEAGAAARQHTAREGEPLAEETPAAPAERAHDVVLSFIVAGGADSCVPTWGTVHGLDEAATALDLDRRIARIREQGAGVVVSFGGAINHELATVCDSAEELTAAYREVVDRYDLDTIDLDIEGPALSDAASVQLRAEAIAALQAERRAAGKPLAVWLTLPVTPAGLTTEGTDLVTAMLASGTDLAGVNVMTMNYGESRGSLSMLDASTEALRSTHRQLGILYERQGTPLGEAALWGKIGATPMIGQNDVPGEIFDLDAAEKLNAFAVRTGLGRMSMWSLNRDLTCGPNYPDVRRVSDACSGIDQGEQTFAALLADGFTGRAAEAADGVTSPDPEAATPVVDDPATSPYPIWSEHAAYLQGTKVVWRGNVYQAKWWTRGELPDDPVLDLWDTPWQLVGPVLPGEKPAAAPTLPAGVYPEWSGTEIYEKGSRILFGGTPYEAKWWTQGDSPEVTAVDPDGSPWAPLTAEEIEDLRAGQDGPGDETPDRAE